MELNRCRTPSELWTKDIPSSWFTLDFGPNRGLSPSEYTLRHGGNYKADSLRTWELQGDSHLFIFRNFWIFIRKDVCIFGFISIYGALYSDSTNAFFHNFVVVETTAIFPVMQYIINKYFMINNSRSLYNNLWNFTGSKDGKIWITLRRHNHDISLINKFATCTWKLNQDPPNPENEPPVRNDDVIIRHFDTCQTDMWQTGMPHNAYRYFRVLQTGRNSSNHNFLVLSGVEFYGDLFEWKS